MAVIHPYHKTPEERHPVAVLLPDGRALTEQGKVIDLDTEASWALRVYGSWEIVAPLMREGKGEALFWAGEPIRWRVDRLDQEQWVSQAGDVTVLKHTSIPYDASMQLAGIVRWAEWLYAHGAQPQRSLGYSGFGLLRSQLQEPVQTMGGEPPPLSWTQGARQQLFCPPRSSFTSAVHLDLPAAYPRMLGGLPVGRMLWRQLDKPELLRQSLGERGSQRPLFVRARVSVPDSLRVGPLPERPLEAPVGSWERCALLGGEETASYPVGKTIEGIWCWDEIAEATRAGCAIEPLEGWIGVGDGSQPFLPWLVAVERGRQLGGFAGQLAKSTANATWGQLVIRGENRRTLAWFEGRELQQRKLPPLQGGLPPSFDLGELICGGVRAQLAHMMRLLAGKLISVHTDGGWLQGPLGYSDDYPVQERIPPGWLVKEHASHLDIIDPQTLRYRRSPGRQWLYRVAGQPQDAADVWFQHAWSV